MLMSVSRGVLRGYLNPFDANRSGSQLTLASLSDGPAGLTSRRSWWARLHCARRRCSCEVEPVESMLAHLQNHTVSHGVHDLYVLHPTLVNRCAMARSKNITIHIPR